MVRPAGCSIDTIEEQTSKALTPMLMRPAGSDLRQRVAAREGALTEAREAGGQLNRHQLPKRRMALSGTWADLRMLASKPAGSAIDVNEEQPVKA